MGVVNNDDINTAVVSPAFRGIVGGQGHGMGKTGHLYAVFRHTLPAMYSLARRGWRLRAPVNIAASQPAALCCHPLVDLTLIYQRSDQ